MQECTNFEQCMNTQINKRKIVCSGDSSCEYSPSIISRTSVQCSGSKSCRQTVDLQVMKSEERGRVYCTGYDSCSDIPFIKSDVVKCYGEQSCLQSEPSSSDSDISISAETLYCSGRASCLQANINISSNNIRTSSGVNCTGEASCNATTINSDGYISCTSNRACSYSLITTSDVVECYGYRSCYGSRIIGASLVQIHGVAAGDFIHIVDVAIVEAYSGFTLSQAIIDSGSSPNMNVELFGVSLDAYHSSSIVICRSGATCLLVCKDNGCHTLEYRCEKGATCNIKPRLCKQKPDGGIINGRDCPRIIRGIFSDIVEKDNINIAVSDVDPFIARDFTMCYNESMCLGERIEDRNDGIMCGGKLSCASAVLLASNKDKIVGCNGVLSCNLARIESSNTLYCWGTHSCKEASIFSAGDIQCLGAESCSNIVLSITKSINSPFLECGSYMSCSDVTMKGNSKQIEYIECNGAMSCYASVFEVGNSILCEGDHSCENSQLFSGGNVECIGYMSCLNSLIKIEEYIFLKASYAAAKSNISYTNSRSDTDHSDLPIKAEGYKSLTEAVIDSDGSAKIIVQLLGHLAGYEAIIICRRGSECSVVCHTTGCKNLQIICQINAICNVRPVGCDGTVDKYDGVACPIIHRDVIAAEMEQILLQRKKSNDLIYESYEEVDVLIGDGMNMNMNVNMSIMQQIMSLTYIQLLLGGTVSVLCVFSLVYLWYKLQYIEYHQLK